MSLVNQLVAAIFIVLFGLVSGTLYIMSSSSRAMLQGQLESHAQDSATHLGLYLAPYIADNDSATVETAVNAIFDSGFYQRIIIFNDEGEILFEKKRSSNSIDGVPSWFTSVIKITPPAMVRKVTYQWSQVGEVHVQSSPGYAYGKLWKGLENSVILFISLSILCLILINYLLRYLLHPLRDVEKQANALSEKRFIQQDKLPNTRELRRVVKTMNYMVSRVKAMFEEQAKNIESLHQSAYQDELTGLSNQRSTLAQLNERLDYRQDFGRGIMLNIHLLNLQEINQKVGIDKTNHLLKYIARSLETLAEETGQHILGRLSGADFILLTNHNDIEWFKSKFEQIDQESRKQLEQYIDIKFNKSVIRVGCSICTETSTCNNLLSSARIATDNAISEQSLWKNAEENESVTEVAATSWKQLVADSINCRQIVLQIQGVYTEDKKALLQNEVFARILDYKGKPVPAGKFIHLVKDLGLMVELDRAVIDIILQQVDTNDTPLSINLSATSIMEPSFISWLKDKLENTTIPDGKLSFELDETSTINHCESIIELREKLKEMNIGFGVDHFGIHPEGFGYLYSIQPDYVKVDGSLIHNLEHSPEDRFFVGSLISIAHSLEIQAYAEHVEREQQQKYLSSLNVDGNQGYLYGELQTLEKNSNIENN